MRRWWRSQIGLARGQGLQLERRHLGVLHEAELVLQDGELTHEAGGTIPVHVGAELEGVAQPLAPYAQSVEIGDGARALGPLGRPDDLS